MTNKTYYLSLGNNIPPHKKYFKIAIKELEKIAKKTSKSSIYQSQAYINKGVKKNQLTNLIFFNMVLSLELSDEPLKLLDKTQAIEKKIGKDITINKNKNINKVVINRKIDIDILLIGERIINNERLIVPHYDLKNRIFFLKPLIEINPKIKNPTTNKYLINYLKKLENKQIQSISNLGLLED